MIRRLFTVASLLSAALFVATALVWIASYRREFIVLCWRQPRDAGAVIASGVLWMDFSPASELAQYVNNPEEPMTPAGYLLFSEVIDDFEGAKLPHVYLPLWPGAPSWAQKRTAITSSEVINDFKTPHQWWGFGYGKSTNPSLSPGFDVDYQFRMPMWGLAIVFAAAPIAKGFDLRRQARRKAAGLCILCGYDLRASNNRCPECGATIGAKAMSAENWGISN